MAEWPGWSLNAIQNLDHISLDTRPDFGLYFPPTEAGMGRLYGSGKVVVRIYSNDHLPPHFHIISPGREALVEIGTMKVLNGRLPGGRSGRAALAWVMVNQAVIIDEWNRVNPRFPYKSGN